MTPQFNLQQEIVVHMRRSVCVTLLVRHQSFDTWPRLPECKNRSVDLKIARRNTTFAPPLTVFPSGMNILPQIDIPANRRTRRLSLASLMSIPNDVQIDVVRSVGSSRELFK